eukprot:gene5802-11708_t
MKVVLRHGLNPTKHNPVRTYVNSTRKIFLNRNSSLISRFQAICFSNFVTKSVSMPSLSPTMTQGTVAVWKKSAGDILSPGDLLCEIETDKATVGFEVQDDGVLAKIIAQAGVELKCGEPIALLVEDEAAYAAFLAQGGAIPDAPLASNVTSPLSIAGSPVEIAPTPRANQRFSPAARHLVDSNSLDVSGLVGTSRGGIISKADVVLGLKSGGVKKSVGVTATTTQAQSLPSAPVPSAAVNAANVPPPHPPAATIVTPSTSTVYEPTGSFTDVPNNKMRKIIAKRLTESKATVPHAYHSIQVEIDALMALRAKLKDEAKAVVSVNDIVIKAAALALRDIPQANGSWNGGVWSHGGPIDISVAVATPNGLITPIITKADGRGLLNINAKVKELAGRAREGKLKPEEFQGGTFTISNLGMFGISEFSAVINAPQACILAVGSGVPRVLPPLPGSKSRSPRTATTLTVTLSADRRVLDEAMASQFLQASR